MANDGTVKIGVDLDEDGFKSGLSKLGSVAKGALAATTAAITAVTTAAGAMGAGIVRASGDLAEYGDNIDKMSQKMGLSAQAYQEYDRFLREASSDLLR